MPVLKLATPNGHTVINPPSEIHNPKIPTYLPFDQAAQKLGLSKKVLTQQIQTGKIGAVQLPSGELLVAADNNGQYKTKAEIIAYQFAHLRRQTINAYQAQEKYNIHYQNFINWARAGHIQFREEQEEGSRPQILMDESEVAYCAYIYKQKKEKYGKIAGVRIFDKEGNPYRVKYPDLAEQRRK